MILLTPPHYFSYWFITLSRFSCPLSALLIFSFFFQTPYILHLGWLFCFHTLFSLPTSPRRTMKSPKTSETPSKNLGNAGKTQKKPREAKKTLKNKKTRINWRTKGERGWHHHLNSIDWNDRSIIAVPQRSPEAAGKLFQQMSLPSLIGLGHVAIRIYFSTHDVTFLKIHLFPSQTDLHLQSLVCLCEAPISSESCHWKTSMRTARSKIDSSQRLTVSNFATGPDIWQLARQKSLTNVSMDRESSKSYLSRKLSNQCRPELIW